jgi:hypothetical protein
VSGSARAVLSDLVVLRGTGRKLHEGVEEQLCAFHAAPVNAPWEARWGGPSRTAKAICGVGADGSDGGLDGSADRMLGCARGT